MRSMTGFAERSFVGTGLQVRISVKSLNHRFFEWLYRGFPLGQLENKFRQLTQEKFHRGRIEVSVEVIFLEPSGWQVIINEGLLEKILWALTKVSHRFGKSPLFSLEGLFSVPHLVEIKRGKLSGHQVAFLEQSFEQTLEAVVKQRRWEGRRTAARLRKHLNSINRSLDRVERLSQRQPERVRSKVRDRLKEMDSKVSVTAERLEEEVAFLVHRADIAEEVLRLCAHVEAIKNLLKQEQEESVGKRLDFLAQEILREANAINSKSPDLDIIREVLTIKNEAESLRQHVQNVE
ncbi:MAG: YicC/YloC family endoribonuclease [Candidatus Aminicenantales bacterium]